MTTTIKTDSRMAMMIMMLHTVQRRYEDILVPLSRLLAQQASQNRNKRTRNQKKKAKLATAKTKTSKTQNPFRFLSLPAELRDYIYELALTEEGGVTLVSATKAQRRIIRRGEVSTDEHYARYRGGIRTGGQDPVPARTTSLVPNLLAVNKQVHAEGIAWLYQQPLILEDTMALHTFLAAIGPANRNVITQLVVKGWGRGRGTHKAMNVAGLTSLADCQNLESFRLDCDITAWHRQPKSLARQLYRDGHHFFERFGVVKGRKDAVLDVLQLSARNFERNGYWGYAANDPEADVEEFKKAYAAEMRKLLGC